MVRWVSLLWNLGSDSEGQLLGLFSLRSSLMDDVYLAWRKHELGEIHAKMVLVSFAPIVRFLIAHAECTAVPEPRFVRLLIPRCLAPRRRSHIAQHRL